MGYVLLVLMRIFEVAIYGLPAGSMTTVSKRFAGLQSDVNTDLMLRNIEHLKYRCTLIKPCTCLNALRACKGRRFW